MTQAPVARWTLNVVGFVVGFFLALGLEVLLLSLLGAATGRTLAPRGLGWVAVPIMAGVAGAIILSSVRAERIAPYFGGPLEVRMGLAGIVSWLLIVSAYVFVAEPFGSYISSREWETLLKWLLVPPVLGLAVLALFRWATKRPVDSPTTKTQEPHARSEAPRAHAPPGSLATTEPYTAGDFQQDIVRAKGGLASGTASTPTASAAAQATREWLAKTQRATDQEQTEPRP